MKYLYLDNFRGFSDTLIPITDVSFLVGENSTGKTSVLSLLKLFSDINFLYSLSFDTEEVKLGHFKDIVSIHSSNRSYFTVGLVSDSNNTNDGDSSTRGFLMTFKEKFGLPSLSHYTLNQGSNVVSLRRTPKRVLINESSIEENIDASCFISTVLGDWKKEHQSQSKKYHNIQFPEGRLDFGSMPLPLLLTMLGSQLDKKNSKSFKSDFIPRPSFDRDLVWLAPIRTMPKRTYDEVRLDFSPEGSHTPYLVRKILSSKSVAKAFKKKLEHIGKQSSLFESVTIRKYGQSATSPFELDIVIDKKALNINSVGYGVSQALPVIVELLHRKKNTLFAIQQPEVHLHPKAQAALGDLCYELAIQEGKGFIIETHSDFLIDRFRLNYREKRKLKPKSQILFFERKAGLNSVISLPIDDSGDLPLDQPNKYREFFIHEEMKILGL